MLARISAGTNPSLTAIHGRNVAAASMLTSFPTRSYNKMSIPLQKLKFVKHPRYGQVFPVVSVDKRNEYPNLARTSTSVLSFFNGLVLYSTFYVPIFTAEFSSIVAHPLVILPSLFLNFYMYKRFYSLFYMDRSIVTSIFLKPCGRKFIVETRDGDTCEVTISDVFLTKYLESYFDERIEFQHGANVYKQIRGNARIMDRWVLENILDNKDIDMKNVQYDFDLTKEFTWDFRDLVEIKKRKRFVTRTYRPTFKVLNAVRSALAFEKARKQGNLVTKRKPFDGYELYDYMPDT